MNKILFVSFCIIVGLLLLGAGFVFGTLSEKSTIGEAVVKQKVLVDSLNSKVIPLVALGQIKSISGNTIVLGNSISEITIIMKEGIKIATLSNPSETKAKPEINISDLKVGDSLQVTMTISPNGDILGVEGTYLPPNFNAPETRANFFQ